MDFNYFYTLLNSINACIFQLLQLKYFCTPLPSFLFLMYDILHTFIFLSYFGPTCYNFFMNLYLLQLDFLTLFLIFDHLICLFRICLQFKFKKLFLNYKDWRWSKSVKNPGAKPWGGGFQNTFFLKAGNDVFFFFLFFPMRKWLLSFLAPNSGASCASWI